MAWESKQLFADGQVRRALELCLKEDKSRCEDCPYFYYKNSSSCRELLIQDAAEVFCKINNTKKCTPSDVVGLLGNAVEKYVSGDTNDLTTCKIRIISTLIWETEDWEGEV